MAKPEPLLKVNALGTVYINQEFSKVMPRGSVIMDISSNSAYITRNRIVAEQKLLEG